MKQKILFTLGILIASLNGYAQSLEYSNMLRFRPKNSGVILSSGAIEGYYLFYPVEKVDKKNIAYEIHLADNNLKKVAEFSIVRPKTFHLLESVYNQNVFIFQFYDTKGKALEFVTIDRKGKEVGSTKVTDLSKWETYRITQSINDPEIENTSIWPSGTTGFIRNTYVKGNKTGFELESYSNSLQSNWKYGSSPKSELLEFADVLFSGEKYVALIVGKKKSAMTKKADYYYVLLDATTGNELINQMMKDKNDSKNSILNAFVNEEDGSSLIVGEYYKPGDEIFKDKSLGLCVVNLDKDGQEISTSQYGWDREIANFKKQEWSDEESEKDKGTNQVWFHTILRSSNGHIFAIGEQFRKQASAMGIAGNVLSGGGGSGASNIELKVGNIVVVEMDAQLKLIDYKIVSKKISRVMLPEGMGLASPQVLAAFVKSYGGFDYQFTSKNSSKDSYDVVYTDLNRKEEKGKDKADVMIGVISINGGEKTSRRVPINSDARSVWYAPAKPGYIVVGEYFKKEKKIVMHLEKIDN